MAKQKLQQQKKSDKKTMSGIIYYPVGDFIIRIKNAAMARKREVTAPKTKLVKSVADALNKEGYLDEVRESNGELVVRLTYRRKEPVIMDLKLVSKPGLRVYMGVDELEKIKRPSIFILSTPGGIVSSTEAKKSRVGGEVIAEVW